MEKFEFKKRYGQNFLNDEKILKKIVDSVLISSKDLIIEIGPGSGALTTKLKKLRCNLIAYEIDKETETFLCKLEDDKCKIIYGDFLKSNITADIKNLNYDTVHIVANIPYYITSPIIKKIISLPYITTSTLLVQKEVADRICANPKSKSYGMLTVFVNYYMEAEQLFTVNKECFIPKPKVDSAVIRLKRKQINEKIKDYSKFWHFVEKAFQYKRKNLKNNLYEYDLKKIEEVLKKYNMSLKNRAEDISVEYFEEIYLNLNLE